MSAPKLRGQRSHSSNVPNDQLPVNTSCTDLCDPPTLPFVGSYARDGVLVYCKQLGLSLRASTTSTGALDTPGICILERIKGRAIQPPRSTRAESGRTESGFWSGSIVETSDELPSTFVSGEDIRLAVMASSDDSILGGPNEGDKGESGHSDGANCGTRSRIDDSNGTVMTCESVVNTMSTKRNRIGLPANARTSPDGEKETACTQPPAELANSPQTVPNGSFSPQNVGAGLNNTTINLSHHQE